MTEGIVRTSMVALDTNRYEVLSNLICNRKEIFAVQNARVITEVIKELFELLENHGDYFDRLIPAWCSGQANTDSVAMYQFVYVLNDLFARESGLAGSFVIMPQYQANKCKIGYVFEDVFVDLCISIRANFEYLYTDDDSSEAIVDFVLLRVDIGNW